jgi:hypothetical protein
MIGQMLEQGGEHVMLESFIQDRGMSFTSASNRDYPASKVANGRCKGCAPNCWRNNYCNKFFIYPLIMAANQGKHSVG